MLSGGVHFKTWNKDLTWKKKKEKKFNIIHTTLETHVVWCSKG